jgi:hypothetical protein
MYRLVSVSKVTVVAAASRAAREPCGESPSAAMPLASDGATMGVSGAVATLVKVTLSPASRPSSALVAGASGCARRVVDDEDSIVARGALDPFSSAIVAFADASSAVASVSPLCAVECV